MKQTFQTLVQQELTSPADDDRYLNLGNDLSLALLLDVIKDDTLRKRETKEREKGEHHITTMAKLMAPMIDGSFSAGFMAMLFICYVWFV
jgi:intraflagellar transport protein 88